MKSKVNELVDGVSKIENGTITLTELEITVNNARDLYEKLIVIRHKVYEQSILETPSYDLSLVEVDLTDLPTDAVSAEPVSNLSEDNSIHFQEEETVVEAEETNDDTLFEIEVNENESLNPSIEVENTAVSWEMNSDEQEEQIDESNEPMSFENDDLEGEITTVNPVEETIQPSTIPTEPIVEENSDEVSGEWISKLRTMESQLTDSFVMSKLDTLIGSFGLNERLQFINELFEGSSEAFSDAVKILDARTGMDTAREKIAEFAQSNNWNDADPETVSDFLAKIKRRYA
jgi:hypothetical protein